VAFQNTADRKNPSDPTGPVAAVRAVALHEAVEGQTPAGYAVTSPHPDQGLITALPMEVTAVVTAVSSDSVLWSL
jgi:hypothetical protein